MTAAEIRETPVTTQVNVTINGRQFRLACEEGQEGHLRQLAKDLDDRITGLRGQFGEIGDARLTVMVALMMADELSESVKKVRGLEQELAAVEDARVIAADREQATQAALVSAFNATAERIESVTKKLNQPPAGAGAPAGQS
jgi:cell division protein ZapA